MRIQTVHARAIGRRKKTSLRVPVDARLTARPLRPARRHSGRPFRPISGDILPLDSDQRTYCKITGVERCTLGTLTLQEAREEGHETVDEFELAWVEHHDHVWLDKQVADLIDHGEPETQAQDTRPIWALNRYEHHWKVREVWVLTILPFDDIPLLLPGLPEEPEAIPTDRIHKRWDIKAARRYQEAVDTEQRQRQARSLARRVRRFALDGDPIALEIEKLIATRYQDAA